MWRRVNACGIAVARESHTTTTLWSARSRGCRFRRLWRRVGKDHRWKHPRVPVVQKLWREEAAEVVLEFLMGT